MTARDTDLYVESLDRPGYERILHAKDPETGLDAFIVIHDTRLGPALGGTRMWPYATAEEALTDALRLARGMTYKSALADLPYGGGKAVISGDPRTDKTERLLHSFARFVNCFAGRFITGEDVGISAGDVAVLAGASPHIVGTAEGSGDPARMTAMGVYDAIEAIARCRIGRPLTDLAVAVQGVGNVGYRLCARLAHAGARLVVADIDENAARRAQRAFGAEIVAPEEIYDAGSTVFSPCALGGVLNTDTVARLRCELVAGSANNQLLADEHGESLRRRGILYAPDYVINAGGLINVAAELRTGGYDRSWAVSKVSRIGATIVELLALADRERLPTNLLADRLARQYLAAHTLTARATGT